MVDSSVIFFVVAILIVGALLFFMISATRRRPVAYDKASYQSAWLSIEQGLQKDDAASHLKSILDADKLVDKALREAGIPGNSFGERLKKSGDKFSSLNSLWHAHKLRNALAHEHGFTVNYDQAKRALAAFKQALQDLGAV
jgi:hypothetical protein